MRLAKVDQEGNITLIIQAPLTALAENAYLNGGRASEFVVCPEFVSLNSHILKEGQWIQKEDESSLPLA